MAHGTDDAHANSESSSDSHSCQNDTSESSEISRPELAESPDTGSSSEHGTFSTGSESMACLNEVTCLKKGHSKKAEYIASLQQTPSASSSSMLSTDEEHHLETKASSKKRKAKYFESTNSASTSTKSSTNKNLSGSTSQDDKSVDCDNIDKSNFKFQTNSTTQDVKPEWSLSEDVLLRAMKEANDGLSWEDIGKSLNRGKSECKSRWKTIKDKPSSSGQGADSVENDPAAEGKTVDNALRKIYARKDDGFPNFPDLIEGSISDKATDSFPTCAAEYRRQKQYWHKHIGRHLYPPSIRVEADAHFSQSDCNVLEMADARYQRMRWLELQAHLYNETGRMMPLEIIRRKCDSAAARTTADIVEWLDGVNIH